MRTVYTLTLLAGMTLTYQGATQWLDIRALLTGLALMLCASILLSDNLMNERD